MSSKTTVAWCRNCCWWLPEDEIGGYCPSDDCDWKMIKRVGYICDTCHVIFWSGLEREQCEHDSEFSVIT